MNGLLVMLNFVASTKLLLKRKYNGTQWRSVGRGEIGEELAEN
jgi:hypothetical protein